MSSAMATVVPASFAVDGLVKNVDAEAYEIPTYDEAFPQLVGGGGGVTSPRPDIPNAWKMQPSLRSSSVTQVFSVPVEERRFNEMTDFGEKGGQQAKVCQDIMSKTGVHIEMSLARDQSLNVVITGKQDKVMQARKMVLQALQTQGSVKLQVPREHHKVILGLKGKKLQELELATATKIQIPRPNENSDMITITGPRDGLEKARHELQLISDEQAKLAMERLSIEKEYHPFICGPYNRYQQQLMAETGAKINVPPLSVNKNEIVVSGEKEGVHRAVQQIMAVYNEKKQRCQTVSVEVRKSQHKYVIGPKGTNLGEIMEKTGVSVEVPPLESPSETITLRGEQDNLGPALTAVYSKANSVKVMEVDTPAWLHRFIIGRKGATIQKIMDDLPRVHIEFVEGKDKISVEGPPEEVNQAQQVLSDMTKELLSRMAFAEIEVDQKYHRHIIGKSGANVNRLKEETGVSIKIPGDDQQSNVIRIEGSPEGVARAKLELLDMVSKMENEKKRDIIIDHRFHRTMIGQQGSKIREIRELFNDEVQITIPDSSKQSDVVSLRGPKDQVDKCYKYLQELVKDLQASNYRAEVHIFKQFHKNIIGKNGATIRKIRDETDTKIDLPAENSSSDTIAITGRKENVEKAKAKIEDIQKELANIKEEVVQIPHKFHNSLIGAKGRLIRSIMEENGNVLIRFPEASSTSDKVIIRGPKDDVEKAKKQLLELATEREESSHSAEVKAKPEYHRFLIGRGGANIRKVKEGTTTRIIFPSSSDQERDIITILGKKEDVEKAKVELERLVADLDLIVEEEIHVDPKYHRHFVARRGEVLRHIADDFGGVTVSFPKNGSNSDRVVLKGAKECVSGATKKIMDTVEDLKAQVTIECVIPQKHHRTILGMRGSHVQEISKSCDVIIKFPERPQQDQDGNLVNGSGDAPLVNGEASDGSTESPAVKKSDVIVITGRSENCAKAKEALQSYVPISKNVSVPFDYHRYVIGQKGAGIRHMMEECDVNISIPPAGQQSDAVVVTGPPANVQKACEMLEARVQELDEEQKDKELKSFVVEVQVDPKYHPKIIGRRGAVISKIRDQHEVNIQFPERGQESSQDIIKVMGYEANANAAKEDILKIVTELEQMITRDVKLDHRVHPRIIGQKGRQIRTIMNDFKVDIRFPGEGDPDPDIISITGAEENVLDCEEHLLNLNEEYIQDIRERELLDQYRRPSRTDAMEAKPKQAPFMVRDAPWDKKGAVVSPKLDSEEDFPGLGTSAAAAKTSAWGPWAGKR